MAHGHDVLRVADTWYFLVTVLDGCRPLRGPLGAADINAAADVRVVIRDALKKMGESRRS